MNHGQIERLLATVSPEGDPGHGRRAYGYAAAARRCDERIRALRPELDRALRALGDAAASGRREDAAADAVLRLAGELDALERLQPRVDAWLRVAVAGLSDQPGPSPFGEGPAG